MAQSQRVKFTDYPFDAVREEADAHVRVGRFILQKWTCSGCGQRLTGNVVNGWMLEGTCWHCNATTNLRAKGCNYTLMIMPGKTVEEVQAIVDAADRKGSAH